jgi:hypothetical protein
LFTAGGTGDYHIYDIDIFYQQAVKVTATIPMFIPLVVDGKNGTGVGRPIFTTFAK